MLKIIFLSAIRSLLKYRQMSIINLLGLVLGLTSFLFAVHYILYEFSFDSFFPKKENIYRVNLKVEKEGDVVYNGAKTPRALYFALKREIPEVEANGLAYFEKCLVTYENTSYANQDVLWVSEDFEKVFPVTMISGIADYSRPRAGIISETAAKALYRDEDPIGKIMKVNEGMPIEITGVYRDLPPNTHLSAQYFVAVKTWVEMGAIGEQGDWYWNGWWNYIKLRENSSPEIAEAKINEFIPAYMGHLREDNRDGKFSLQPLRNLHFIKGIEGELGAVSHFSSLVNLIIIALVTLIIAWLNYVSLSTAHAQARSTQISMRKLIGASNTHLWHQSLAESFILNFTALLISLPLYFLFLKSFASFFNIPVNKANIPIQYILLILLIIVMGGILFSSIYHGIELAKINNLSEQTKAKKGTAKKGLVIAQMALSIIFLISTLMVYRQVSFMKNKDLGVVLDKVVVCNGPASLNSDPHKREKYDGFKSEVLSHSEFRSATFNMSVPGKDPVYGFHEFNNPANGKNPDHLFFENNAGEGLIETYQFKLLAGNEFKPKTEQNFNKVIVSELAAQLLGYENPEDAVGRQIYRDGNDTTALEIIGVVADFHNEGLHKAIYPVVWNNRYPNEFGFFSVRLNAGNVQSAMKKLENIWNNHYPRDNFSFVFADEQFNQQYESDTRYSKFYLWLTLLSIGIATMGLYGLILFYLEKHKKEISLRKVNGATTGQVLLLLYLNFAKWVIVAFAVAIPVTWLVMQKWLESFAYRTSLAWWIFVVAGLCVLGIALLTVSLQSWKTATQNPVEALRYE